MQEFRILFNRTPEIAVKRFGASTAAKPTYDQSSQH